MIPLRSRCWIGIAAICSILTTACDQSEQAEISKQPEIITPSEPEQTAVVNEDIDTDVQPVSEVELLEENIKSISRENELMRQHIDTLLLKIRESDDQLSK